jgi:hypothetical protein
MHQLCVFDFGESHTTQKSRGEPAHNGKKIPSAGSNMHGLSLAIKTRTLYSFLAVTTRMPSTNKSQQPRASLDKPTVWSLLPRSMTIFQPLARSLTENCR